MSDATPAALLEASGVSGEILRTRPLGGGCIADVRRVTFTDGRTVVVKIGPSRRGGMHPTALASGAHEEAAGLEAIAATGTVRVPSVLGVATTGTASILVLEDLGDATRPSTADWTRFGRTLADLHATPVGDPFGLEHDNHLGDTPQDNRLASEPGDWATFVRERRLGPMVAALEHRGDLGPADSELFARVSDRLSVRLPSGIRPALLHGDLWSGNAHVTDTGIAVIDPAAFRGDPLFELGMMRLFGGFPAACEQAHLARLREHLGPETTQAAEFRIELGRLHHLLNHWLLFGAGYADQARQVAATLAR